MVVCGTVLVVAWLLAIGRLGDADVVFVLDVLMRWRDGSVVDVWGAGGRQGRDDGI